MTNNATKPDQTALIYIIHIYGQFLFGEALTYLHIKP